MKLFQILSLLLVLCLACSCARADVFSLPSGIRAVEDEAFSGIDFSDGVYIPPEVTDIADSAFDAADIYGIPGTQAQSFAEHNGFAFYDARVTEISLDAPAFVSPYRPFSVSVSANSSLPYTVQIDYIQNSVVAFSSAPSDNGTVEAILYEGGLYDVYITVTAGGQDFELYLEDEIEVYSPVEIPDSVSMVPVGERICAIDESELRPVTLYCDDPTVEIDGTWFSTLTPGSYTLTAVALCDDDPVYTDFTVVAVIPAEAILPGEADIDLYLGEEYRVVYEIVPAEAAELPLSWISSDPTVASVSEDGVITTHKGGECSITVSCVGAETVMNLRVLEKVEAVEVFSIDGSSLLQTGSELRLGYRILPEGANNIDVTWVSETPAIAQVDPVVGYVTGIAGGTVRITAVSDEDPGITGSILLTVYRGVTSVSADVPDELYVGESFILKPVVLPEEMSDLPVSISVSDESVLCADGNTVTACAPGTAVVTLTAPDWTQTRYPILVKQHCYEIAVLMQTVYVNPGSSFSAADLISCSPVGCDLSDLDFCVSDETIAVTDALGKVTAIRSGSTVLTVTAGSAQATITVNVVVDGKTSDRVAVSSSYAVLTEGARTTASLSLGNAASAYKKGVWYSEDESIVRVEGFSSDGTVTLYGAAAGLTNVYVITNGGARADVQVLVNPLIVKSLRLSDAAVSLAPGETYSLSCSCLPAGASLNRVSWYSSDPAVADTDDNGVVTAVSAGRCLIYAIADQAQVSCSVTVEGTDMTSAVLSEESVAGLVGEVSRIEYSYEPYNASPAVFDWYSDDPSIADVDSANRLIRCLSPGETIIRGYAKDSSGLMLTIAVTVSDTPLRALLVGEDELTLTAGQSHSVHYSVYPADASCSVPEFASSDPRIALIDENGMITARCEGSCLIIVTAGSPGHEITAEIAVTVLPASGTVYRALVMGQYTAPGSDGYLPFSENGTTGVSDALSLSAIDGTAYDTVLMQSSPSKESFRAALAELSLQTDTDDVTVIYIITHGSVDQTNGYYLQTSSGVKYMADELIEDVSCLSGHVVLVLCTCHSGQVFESGALQNIMQSGGLYTGQNGEGRLSVICSSSETKSTYYDSSSSSASYDFFTRAFTQALGWDMLTDTGTYTGADTNGDGTVTLSELFNCVLTDTQGLISAYLQQYGYSSLNGHINQFPSHFFAVGDEGLALFRK